MRIGVFGGTFDPVHQGHLELARRAKAQFHLDRILFVPARVPPHKQNRDNISAMEHRAAMLEAALTGEDGMVLCREELDRPEISYTVETLRRLKALYPNDELFLILGADNLKEFPLWREPETIRQLAALIAAPRPGGDRESPVPGVQWVDMPLCPYSASEIRRKLNQGEEAGEALPDLVKNYIRKHRLYTHS